MAPPRRDGHGEGDRDGLGGGDAVAVDVVDDLVFQDRHQGEGVARSAGVLGDGGSCETYGVPGVAPDLGALGKLGEGRRHTGVDVRAAQCLGDRGGHGAGAVYAVAVLCVAGVVLGKFRRCQGSSRMYGCQHRRPYACGVVEEVRVVMARGGRAQTRREVAQPGPYGDTGTQGQHRRLHLGCPYGRSGDLARQLVPCEVDRGAYPPVPSQVAEQRSGGGEHRTGRERRPLGVVGGAQPQWFGRLVEGDGHRQCRSGVVLGEGVQFACEPPRPLRHTGRAVPGGGPPGRVARGDAQQQSLDTARIVSRWAAVLRTLGPHRAHRAVALLAVASLPEGVSNSAMSTTW